MIHELLVLDKLGFVTQPLHHLWGNTYTNRCHSKL